MNFRRRSWADIESLKILSNRLKAIYRMVISSFFIDDRMKIFQSQMRNHRIEHNLMMISLSKNVSKYD